MSEPNATPAPGTPASNQSAQSAAEQRIQSLIVERDGWKSQAEQHAVKVGEYQTKEKGWGARESLYQAGILDPQNQAAVQALHGAFGGNKPIADWLKAGDHPPVVASALSSARGGLAAAPAAPAPAAAPSAPAPTAGQAPAGSPVAPAPAAAPSPAEAAAPPAPGQGGNPTTPRKASPADWAALPAAQRHAIIREKFKGSTTAAYAAVQRGEVML